MLSDCGILRPEDARTIRDGLDAISPDDVKRAKYDGTCEDLFFFIERLLAKHCGEDAAGRLHTARSRNDIDMTMYRMQQRQMILSLAAAGSRTSGKPPAGASASIGTTSLPPIRTRSRHNRPPSATTCWP